MGILIDDYLVYKEKYYEPSQLEEKAQNINKNSKMNSNIKFYLYYIEKDTDINFETNEKLNAYEYMTSYLDSNVIHSKFSINSISDFKNYFYKTDHHWNYKGSYKGYKEVLELMGINDYIMYDNEICLKEKMSGTKASTIGGQLFFKEPFCAYTFNLSEHKIYINNEEVESYGHYNDYINGKKMELSYGGFYGSDYGLIEFDYNQPKKENLLIIGESYDNAINEILASHFNKTYNVDLRAYEKDIGEKFNLKKFVNKYNIDNVLLIGNIDFYLSDTFMLS